MKNPAPQIRKALYELLNGNLTYNSNPVPVYEGEGDNVDVQVLIKEYSDTPKNTKHYFGSSVTQLIEVVSEQDDARTKTIDDIGEQVMQLIKPTPQTTGISLPDFQVIGVEKQSQNYLSEQSGSDRWIKRLLIRYKFLTIEN